MWGWRRTEKISWTERVINEMVLGKVKKKEFNKQKKRDNIQTFTAIGRTRESCHREENGW